MPTIGDYTPAEAYKWKTQYDPYENSPNDVMGNYLRSVGIRPGAGNPYANYLQNQGSAYANAFTAARAGQPGVYANNIDLPGHDFYDFIKGGMESGNMNQTVSQVGRNTQQLLNLQRQNAASPPTADMVNPYLERLSDQWGQNNGQGLLGWYGSLYSPYMGPGLRSAYAQGLQNTYDVANTNYANAVPGGYVGDIYKFILGY